MEASSSKSDTDNSDTEKHLHEALEMDTTLASCSDKLANLESLLLLFIEDESYTIANGFENDDISSELIEKMFTFDLLSAILNFELTEVDDLMGGLEDLTVDSNRNISSSENSTDLVNGLVRRSHDSEGLIIKQSRDRVLEMKIQLAKLQMTSFSSSRHDFEQKGTLRRLLEKSLARELELDKDVKELKQNEEDLKSKVRLVEQVAFCMQEPPEDAWGRFLEADNTTEVLTGISKDNLEKLRVAQFKLEEANASNETSQKRLNETESEIEALRVKIDLAESRAQSSEEKATHLNDLNVELLEEVDFLKGSNDGNTKKVSVLEEQLRELDNQLQHSRALAESSQEQQNMLYTAIWDMETLIDELKQNVVKAECRADSAEGRCVILTETNSDITKELEFMRSRVDYLGKSLSQADLEKKSYAKDVNVRSSRIMEIVLQLAVGRERVQKQLISCKKENKLLRVRLLKEQKKNTTVVLQDDESCGVKEFQLSMKATETSSEIPQVEKLPGDLTPDQDDRMGSSSTNHATNSFVQVEPERFDANGSYRSRRTCVLVAILVVLLSSFAAHFLT